MLKNKIKKNNLKIIYKKSRSNLGWPFWSWINFSNLQPMNPRHKLNHETQIQTNLMLNDEIR